MPKMIHSRAQQAFLYAHAGKAGYPDAEKLKEMGAGTDWKSLPEHVSKKGKRAAALAAKQARARKK